MCNNIISIGVDEKRIFALEIDNDIKGLEERKKYIEFLIAKLDKPDFIVLPELAIWEMRKFGIMLI